MRRLVALLIALTFLTSCSTHSRRVEGGPALGGYCPVSYQRNHQAVPGIPSYQEEHEGLSYHFADGEAQAAFRKNPERYLPAFDGWCAYGVAFGKKVPVDPTVFSIVGDRLYLNKNPRIGRRFDSDSRRYIGRANRKWSQLSASPS